MVAATKVWFRTLKRSFLDDIRRHSKNYVTRLGERDIGGLIQTVTLQKKFLKHFGNNCSCRMLILAYIGSKIRIKVWFIFSSECDKERKG